MYRYNDLEVAVVADSDILTVTILAPIAVFPNADRVTVAGEEKAVVQISEDVLRTLLFTALDGHDEYEYEQLLGEYWEQEQEIDEPDELWEAEHEGLEWEYE